MTRGEVEPGFVRVGETEHGGTVYGEPQAEARDSTLIQVATPHHVYWYGLVGGP